MPDEARTPTPDERLDSYKSLCKDGCELLQACRSQAERLCRQVRRQQQEAQFEHDPDYAWRAIPDSCCFPLPAAEPAYYGLAFALDYGPDPSFARWESSVAACLDKWFRDASLSTAWAALPSAPIRACCADDHAYWDCLAEAVRERLEWLANHAPGTATVTQIQGGQSMVPATRSRRVFVVHGQNEAAREKVARFLEHLDLKPVILHEEANKGLTIIEKFEAEADAAFAVVLLTADDVGGRAPIDRADLKPRARQNVIFELGFFLAKLGRQRVCALREEGVEIPSDYAAVIYVELDPPAAWKLALAKELQAAGLSVDLNKLSRADHTT